MKKSTYIILFFSILPVVTGCKKEDVELDISDLKILFETVRGLIV